MAKKNIGKLTNPGPQPEELRNEQWEWLRVTLSSIGDAVITTDTNGYVNFLNPVAQTMTGWTPEDAIGKPLRTIFKIINEETRLPAENPATRALREGVVVGLANHTVLIAKDGKERPIDNSAAPTVDEAGQVIGVALVFRDVSQRKRLEQEVQDARAYADNILATLRDPFLVLDKNLRVVTANHAFYENFHVTAEETQGCFVYDLGNRQWDIPKLRTLLEEVLLQGHAFQDVEVEHDFSTIGEKVMLLNARRIRRPGNNSELILLNIEDITERRLVQLLLQVSETRFRRLFEAAHDGILILDTASRKITHVNPFLTNLLDYPAEHFLGKELWEIGFLRDKQASEAAMQQLDEQGEIRYESLPLEDRHGSTHPVEMIASLYQEDHHPVIQCNFRDISDRKQAEETLLKAGALQSAIFNSANFSSIATDEKGVIQIFNVGAERMLGYTAAEVTNTITPADISDPQELITRAKALSKEFATTITPGFEALVFKAARGIEDIYELTYIRQDGSRFPAVVSVTALRDDQNAIIGYLLIGTDNTARKQVEAERMLLDQRVRDQQFYTRSLIESNIDALMTTDPRGIITDVNKQMEALTGCTRDELIGAPFKDYFTDPERAEAGIKLVLAEGKVTDYELTARGRDGQETVVSYNATTFHDRDRKLRGVFAAARDVTERNRLELQMREQKAKLSDLHRRKDEFLAMLSHELRSPLAPIANAVQLLSLQRGSENLIQQQARGIIERQMGQLQHLVNDLLEVSRITTGRVQLRRERAAIGGIAERAVETVRPLIEQRRQELTVSLPTEPVWLHADAARLEQVVVNLLSNAAEYTGEGGHVWLSVELEGDKERGRGGDGETRRWGDKEMGRQGERVQPFGALLSPSQVVIRVRDTGVGISPALLPRIFDLFTQAERSLDRSQGGLGIGLALVQRLTELHDGKVEASSVLGEGSEFVVRLPVLPTDASVPTSPVTETDQSPTRPFRVLVVDDNVDTVLSFSMLLKASGHDVRTAHDGLAAVQAALDYRPDVVLLDIGLPGLNGYEVAKRLRQQPEFKNIVLVALTSYGQDADRQTALQAGFNHHLVKPARLAQLQEILATVSEQVI